MYCAGARLFALFESLIVLSTEYACEEPIIESITTRGYGQKYRRSSGHALLLNAADPRLATAAAHTPRRALCAAGSALASRNVLELGSCLGFALPLLGSTPT